MALPETLIDPSLPGETTFGPMFDSNPLPMWVYDANTLRFLAVNAAAIRHYGYTREDFARMTTRQLCASADVATMALDWERGLGQTEINQTAVWKHRRKDATVIDVEITWNRIPFDGRTAVLVLAHDITERKRAEKQVREQASLLNLAHDAIIVIDLDDRVTFWNKGAEALYSMLSNDALDRKLSDLVKQEAGLFEIAKKELLISGEWKGETRHTICNGKEVAVSSRWTLVRGDDGEPKSILVINTDITEKKKLEGQFLRSQRLESIGTLASGIAHDLNNILAPILMSVGLLRRSLADEESMTLLGTIEVSAERGADIVKQVLTFARGAEGDRILLQPKHLISELVKMMSQTFPKNIGIRMQIAKDVATVSGDITQLHQVLLNLCVNARDAMPQGGCLTIGAETVLVDEQAAGAHPDARVGRYVVMKVNDSGEGIPRHVLEKIFDPFFTTKEPGKGTGLGLSTAMGIVKSHGGFVTVDSEVGVGTAFRVFLPASEKGGEAVKQETLATPMGNGELILVVDDEPSIRNAAIKTLEAHGYRAYTAEDGTDALALYFQRRSEIQAVLTDIEMDLMDGVALVRALKKVDPMVKIIASSGQSQDIKKVMLEEMGVSWFLDKPYSADQLLFTVHKTLNA